MLEAITAETAGHEWRYNMRIKITEIEADARELRESNTLAANFSMMLSRAFQNREPFEEEEQKDDAEEVNE